jgi:probable F420-dependent oxidoreductase
MDLGSIGVWSGALRRSDRGAILKASAELEELGYGTLWFPGGEHAGLADLIKGILGATRRVAAATGIVNIWTHPAAEVAAEHHDIWRTYPERFLLGLGISHQRVVEGAGLTYEKPLQKMRSYLDELDRAATPVPIEQRILASLGPVSLKLSRDRANGTHPYFMSVEHTRIAREAVGPGKIVAPEQMVVLETDPDRARAVARPSMDRYLHAPNYTSNLLRLGFSEDDLANGGSDRLVDALIAWGDPPTIMQRVREHLAAGADHVCIQVLSPGASQELDPAMQGWRQLARELPAGARS